MLNRKVGEKLGKMKLLAGRPGECSMITPRPIAETGSSSHWHEQSRCRARS